jgi:hypothetical protein
LTGTFVTTVNGDLKVGTLKETITVTGESPVVDVQSVQVRQTVSKEILAAISTARTAANITSSFPGSGRFDRTSAALAERHKVTRCAVRFLIRSWCH